jgi:hypothetical protein
LDHALETPPDRIFAQSVDVGAKKPLMFLKNPTETSPVDTKAVVLPFTRKPPVAAFPTYPIVTAALEVALKASARIAKLQIRSPILVTSLFFFITIFLFCWFMFLFVSIVCMFFKLT